MCEVCPRFSQKLAGDQQKNAKIWSVETGALVCTLPCPEYVKRVDLSGDKEILATGCGNTCQIWDLSSGMLICSQEKGGRVRMAAVRSQQPMIHTHNCFCCCHLNRSHVREHTILSWTFESLR